MQKFLILIVVGIAGWIGWWLGAKVGLFSALIVGLIFSGVGLYAARRLLQDYLGG